MRVVIRSVLFCFSLFLPFEQCVAQNFMFGEPLWLITERLGLVTDQVVSKLCIAESQLCFLSDLSSSEIDIVSSQVDLLKSTISITENTLCSLLDVQSACGAQAISVPTTISVAGSYCVASSIVGDIVINENDVELDLNGYSIDGGIRVNASYVNIKNGAIKNGSSGNGVYVAPGFENITLEALHVRNCIRGVYIDSSAYSSIVHSSFLENTTAVFIENSYGAYLFAVEAVNSLNAGFDLVTSQTNCFIECKALSTGKDNIDTSNTTIAGFIATDGFGNVFERCIANGTHGLLVDDDASIIAGFALRGSESCSKIIECESSDAKAGSNVYAVPHGILLEPSVMEDLPIVEQLSVTGTILATDWSPDGKYIAFGGSAFSAGEAFQVASFDRVSQSVTVFNKALDGTVRSISWSPDGQYIAVVVGLSLQALYIFEFDAQTQSVTSRFVFQMNEPYSATWSPDGQYIVVVGNLVSDTSSDDLQIIQLDRVSNSATIVASAVGFDMPSATTGGVAWSPDGRYIAVGREMRDQIFEIFEFDRANNLVTSVAGALSTFNGIFSVAWSPDGHYIAVGGKDLVFGLNGDSFQIIEFDRANMSATPVASFIGSGTEVRSVDWSSNGRYIAIGTDDATMAVRIIEFDRASVTATQQAAYPSSLGTVFSVNWSPDGQYLAARSNTPSFIIMEALQFPSKNVIKDNMVYCNGQDTSSPFTGATGVGISGSSIGNMIIGNTAYNNPPTSSNFFVGSNYQFVTNVFNPLFGQAPTDLQNISLNGCEPITSPDDLALLMKQIKNKVLQIQEGTISAALQSSLDELLICGRTAITSSTTISTSGIYCVGQNVAMITVASSDVDIDLSDHQVEGIEIASGVERVKLANGTINASGTYGIVAQSGSRDITLDTILVRGAVEGIKFNGVSDSTIQGCSVTHNTTGIMLESSFNIQLEKSEALCNLQAGIELLNSYTCCVLDCKALSSGEGNSAVFENNVFGFVSSNGNANIFERCIAQATQALSTTDMQSVVANIAFLGSESCSKIIECEASGAVSSPNGVSVPYGIYLQATLDQLIITTGWFSDEQSCPTVQFFAWSPDGNYLATAGDLYDGTGSQVQLFKFDWAQQRLRLVDTYEAPCSVAAIRWAPGGNFIAIGGDNLGSDSVLQILHFDSAAATLSLATDGNAGTSGAVSSVDWSPDGRYLAIGGGGLAGNNFRVLQFNAAAQATTVVDGDLSGDACVNSVHWSPDGAYIVVGGEDITSNQMRIYSFDKGAQTIAFKTSAAGSTGGLFTARWAPNGYYIAAVGDQLADGNFQLYYFDRTAELLTLTQTVLDGSGMASVVEWSADNKYVALGGCDLTLQPLQLYAFSLDSQQLTFVDNTTTLTAGDVLALAWSPDGQYVAVGGNYFAPCDDQFQLYQAEQFPSKNIITKNVLYCNGNDLTITLTTGDQFTTTGGVGMYGSSIANMIIGNTAYNNPPTSSNSQNNLGFGANYQWVTNVFNELFGQSPSLVQNIALDGCTPISQPEDIELLLKQNLQKSSLILSAFDVITVMDFIDMLPKLDCLVPSVISSSQTISTAGNYGLCANVGTITIAESNVVLNLRGYTISNGITVNSNLANIKIKNGVVESSDTGILVNSGSTNISISDVQVKNAVRGIYFDTVGDAFVDHVSLAQNTTGIQIEDSYKIIIEDSRATCNVQAGFELINSSTCVLQGCHAFATGEGNTNASGDESNVYGFVACDSVGNVFEQCIANSTQNLNATDWNTLVAGFALLGTGTQCNKIIECESANAQTNANGFGWPYGIYMEPTTPSSIEELAFVSNSNPADADWSPDGRNFVVSNFSGRTVSLYEFDYSRAEAILNEVVSTSGEPVKTKWSPSGNLLVTCNFGVSAILFEFDRTNRQLIERDTVGTSQGTACSWSSDGRYVVIGAGGAPSVILFVDTVSKTLDIRVASFGPGSVREAEWHPHKDFIAFSGFTGAASVYSYNRSDDSTALIDSLTLSGDTSVRWSPSGRYLSYLSQTSNELRVYEFVNDLSLELVFSVAAVTSSPCPVEWSADERFLTTVSGSRLTIYRFDPQETTLETVVQGPIEAADGRAATFAPSGEYILTTFLATNAVIVYSGLNFPSANVVTNNTVYCNSNGTQGIGISGSSVANMITRNKAYNNPFNYAYVQNVFNPLFGIGPTLLQNISTQPNEPIPTPGDLCTHLKRAVLLAESIVDNCL